MNFKDKIKILQRLVIRGEKRVVHSSSIECPPFYCFSHCLEKENVRYIARRDYPFIDVIGYDSVVCISLVACGLPPRALW